jgi:hypothetical protein
MLAAKNLPLANLQGFDSKDSIESTGLCAFCWYAGFLDREHVRISEKRIVPDKFILSDIELLFFSINIGRLVEFTIIIA